MGACYSLDLRERVARFVEAGGSRWAAARRFAVSASCAIKLLRRHARTGSAAPARQGRPTGSGKLVPVAGFLIATVEASPDMGRPLPPQGPSIRDPWSGLAVRAAAAGPLLGSRRLRRAVLLLASLVSYAVFRTGLPVAGFSSRRYRRHVAANADFRKYDDGLRLTIACPVATAEAIERALEVARAAGLLRFGLSRQDAAVVTCITPSVMRGDHVHFVDGADGGYARAALQLKADRA